MNNSNLTFFDTDMFIHRLYFDASVNKAAREEFENCSPTAMCAFSLVELKGNYIQCLKLIHEKIIRSNSLENTMARILSTGGRKSVLMLGQLISELGGINWKATPWAEARLELLTHLDAQIDGSWHEFISCVDKVVSDFQCSRAEEPPKYMGDKWDVSIPNCKENNSTCKIVNFMNQYKDELSRLIDTINSLDSSEKTSELQRIKNISQKTVKSSFPWNQGNTCRKVGDLLIALQSKTGKLLISSNRKEHGIMNVPLKYNFREFPIAKIRPK